jgi:predicted RNA-binding Zn ribbon-like protein
VEFNSHIDAVVGVAVQLVNTLTPGSARGREYSPPSDGALVPAVTAVLRTGSPGTRDVTPQEASDLAAAAARLRRVFAAVADEDLDDAARQVNSMLADTGAHPWLERHDGQAWHLHFHGTDSAGGGWPAGCATGLAVVLGSEHHDRLGICTAPRCDRVYVDTSRNGTRRFCSTSCQNRVKAAAYRTRHATCP